MIVTVYLQHGKWGGTKQSRNGHSNRPSKKYLGKKTPVNCCPLPYETNRDDGADFAVRGRDWQTEYWGGENGESTCQIDNETTRWGQL